MNELLAIIEKLDKQLSNLFERLDINLPSVQKDIYDRLFQFINQLSTKKGNLVASVDNLKLLNQFKNELNNLLNDSKGMDKIVSDFIKGIQENTIFINEYFSLLMSTFNADKQIINTLQNLVINETIDLLKGNSFYVNLIEPVRTILQTNITTKASYKDLQNELSQYLDQKTQKYVKQITNDAVLGYERSYMQNIAQDLELSHYYYQGTKIDTSRQFCKARAGKVFTQSEVENWVNLSWAGKNKATNKSNIFVYAGGYNCRHRILPISLEIYDFIKNN